MRSWEEHILGYSFLSQQFDLISSASLQHMLIGNRYSQTGLFMRHNLGRFNVFSLSATSLTPAVMKEFSVLYKDLQGKRPIFQMSLYYISEQLLLKPLNRSTLIKLLSYHEYFTFGVEL